MRLSIWARNRPGAFALLISKTIIKEYAKAWSSDLSVAKQLAPVYHTHLGKQCKACQATKKIKKKDKLV